MKHLQSKIYQNVLNNLDALPLDDSGAKHFVETFIEPILPLWESIRRKIYLILDDFKSEVQRAKFIPDYESKRQSTAYDVANLFNVTWSAKEGFIYSDADDSTVAFLPYFDKYNSQHLQYQKLIAAAPEMLDLLLYFENEIESTPAELNEALIGLIRIHCTRFLDKLHND